MLKDPQTGEAVAFAIELELEDMPQEIVLPRGQTIVRNFRVGATAIELREFVHHGASTVGLHLQNESGSVKHPCMLRSLDLQRATLAPQGTRRR